MYLYTFIGPELTSNVSNVATYSLPVGANAFLVQAITQNVRVRGGDNSAPTASIGMQIKASDPVRLLPIGQRSFQALQETATAYFYVQPVRVDWVEP